MLRTILKGLLSSKQNQVITRYYDWVNTFHCLSPELIDNVPQGETVLVVAPHCDDEALGCGGVLYKHHQEGCTITVAFMTDGSQSQSDLSQDDLIQTRKQEAERSAQILGINRCVFLDYPDRGLIKNEKTVKRMADLLQEIQPDLVYLPFHLENHPDHRATTSISLEALKRWPAKNVLLYEVWTTMIHNRLVDISSVIDKKLKAIRTYRSQKDIDAFAEKIKGLNRFRSLQSDNQFEFAEAFFKLDPKDFDKLLSY